MVKPRLFHGCLSDLWQDCSAEVEGARKLTEPRARDDADAGLLQQGEGVEDVRRLAGLPGSRHSLHAARCQNMTRCSPHLFRQVYLGEGIHGTLHHVAAEPFNGVERVGHQLGAGSEAGQCPVLKPRAQ